MASSLHVHGVLLTSKSYYWGSRKLHVSHISWGHSKRDVGFFYKLEARGSSFLGFLVGGEYYAKIERGEVVRE